MTPELRCIERGRRRLEMLFPDVRPWHWEHRSHGLWRTREISPSFFIRDQWFYVVLRGDEYLTMTVAAELLHRHGDVMEAEIRAQADRALG